MDKTYTFTKGPNTFSWAGPTVKKAWANSGMPANQFLEWWWYEIGPDNLPVRGFDDDGLPIKSKGDAE